MKHEKYTCFEDYPTDIQEEALKIVEEGNPLEYFREVISKIHTGDDESIDLILLSIGSLFIQNSKPVHQQIKGDIGAGKTSLLQKTLRIVPKRYIQTINNISPEYLYYKHRSFNKDYNIFLLDNINPTPATLTMLETLADNETKNKIFIESKNVEFQLAGKNLFFCIFNKENNSKSLKCNLLSNNVSETTPKKLFKSKRNIAGGFDENNAEMQYLYSITNATFEKLIEYPLKVFNHHLIDHDEMHSGYIWRNSGDLQHFTELSKARTFYYQKQSQRVDNILIGTKTDADIIKHTLQGILLIRDYKLSTKQKDLLLILKVYTDKLHEHTKELYETDKKRTTHIIPTYENLAESLNITKDVIINWVKGKGGYGEKGLEEKGFVKPMKIDPKKRTSQVLLYLNPRAVSIQKALKRPQYKPKNRQEEMQNMKFNEYTTREALKLLLKIANCKNSYECIPTFMRKNRLNIATYKELAKYLQKFKAMYESDN